MSLRLRIHENPSGVCSGLMIQKQTGFPTNEMIPSDWASPSGQLALAITEGQTAETAEILWKIDTSYLSISA